MSRTFTAGIDVGTTNIDALLLDIDEGRVVERYSVPNHRQDCGDPLAYVQDADAIVRAAQDLLGRFTRKPAAVGVTGQVHGVLYLDGEGRAVSPLYTWLDRHGEGEPGADISPQHRLADETGLTLPVGYGLLTHYALRLAGMVPAEARRLTGINEYVAGVIAGGRPLDKTDDSILASYGCWDAAAGRHNADALAAILGRNAARSEIAFLGPAEPFTIAGYTSDGVPVAYPIGDNQAGFLGAVARPEQECLLSIGTSGQLSVFSASTDCPSHMELRPYFGRGWLHVGAALCAGKAWETLAALFAEVLRLAGQPPGMPAVYRMMNTAASCAAASPSSLTFDTALNGTRQDAARRGSVTGVTLDNFTVGNLSLACAEGIAGELAAFADSLGPLFEPVKQVVAVGAAVRKNELFKPVLERRFKRPLFIPQGEGGAALGAALAGALASGLVTRSQVSALVEAAATESTAGGP